MDTVYGRIILCRWFWSRDDTYKPGRTKYTYALRFEFEATNNEAEYEALIAGLRIAEQMGIKNLQPHVDSRLVANQVNGSYIAMEPGMIQYLGKVKTLTSSFKKFSIKQVPRSESKKAYVVTEVLTVVEEEANTWMTPIYEYITEETLHAERKKARAVRLKSRRYTVINGVLYKKSFLEPSLRCVGPLQANYVIREIHEGSCSMHAGPRSVVAKAIRTGYYWPTMDKDARKVIQECQDCQVYRPVPRNPQQKFGLPGEIISDNGKQFRDNPFKDWCEKLNIRQRFTSVKHLQANGFVERANRSLGEGVKARLDKGSRDWMEEISHKKREQAAIREARSKLKMEKYYNSKVRNTNFKPGDLVYRNNNVSHAEDKGKLGPKWEGPYEVIEALGKGAYKLRDRNGKLLPRT
ncbi:reverse transcriptase domain-containing protein [Tanacetum coccineum]